MKLARLAPLALAALTASNSALAAGSAPAPKPLAPPAGQTSIHQQELLAHGVDKLQPRIVPPLEVLRRSRLKAVSKVVYGYYPHWAHDLTTIRWESLTHLAWFSVELNSQGGVDALHGWPDAATVQAAHDAGVRVDLAFTLFSGAGIKTLVTDPALRAEAIKNMLDLVEQGGADGVSVDFEGFVDGTKDGFKAFIAELRAAMIARGMVDHQISLAGPAVDWGDEWDIAALLKDADYFFIMAYDYFWSGSTKAGPTGILRTDAQWAKVTSWSALRSIAHYTSLVSPETRRKIIYGVPYYGREWTTTSEQPAAATIANVGSVTYSAARDDLAGGATRLWDEGTKTPWYAWKSNGTWHEVYYDDEESLGHKYELALQQDLAGVGMWALNYDIPHTELWDAIDQKLGPQPEPPEGHRLRPIVVGELPFHDERDTKDGASQYFNYYSCAPEIPEYGREWVYQVDVCQPGTLKAHVPEYPSADPDVHLLTDVVETACVARAHTDLEKAITPGRYYVVVDTFVDGGVELEGPYTLDIDFAPEAGSQGCAAYLQCDAGSCVCPVEGQIDCNGGCVDPKSDAANCGACGSACGAGESCVGGVCQSDTGGVGGGGVGGGGVGGGVGQGGEGGEGGSIWAPDDYKSGCGCSVPGTRRGGAMMANAAALLLVVGALGRRRRRSEESK